MLVTDAVAAHAPEPHRQRHVSVAVAADPDAPRDARRPLRADGAAQLLADGGLPGVGNVLERVADEVREARVQRRRRRAASCA